LKPLQNEHLLCIIELALTSAKAPTYLTHKPMWHEDDQDPEVPFLDEEEEEDSEISGEENDDEENEESY